MQQISRKLLDVRTYHHNITHLFIEEGINQDETFPFIDIIILISIDTHKVYID